MLKHLYKSFIISIISGSLLTVQPNVAFAAGTNTTDQKGVITNTQSHSFDKVKDEDMLASLGMLGGGFVAGRMLQAYTPITNDVMIAGAAGVAFIAGEVMSNLKFKGTIDAMTIEVQKKSDGTVNEEQIQRLIDLKKSYEEAKKTTKTKKSLQMASSVAFGVAAAYAGYLNYTEYALMKACYMGMTAADKVCSNVEMYRTPFTKLDTIRQFPIQSGLAEKKTTVFESALATPYVCIPIDVTTAAATVTTATAAVNTPCKAAVAAMSKNQVFTFNPLKLTTQNKLFDSYSKTLMANNALNIPVQSLKPENRTWLDVAVDLVMQRAQASWLPMLGLSAGVAATFFPILAGTAAYIDLWMFVPFNRMLVFGGLGGIAYLAAKSSDNQIKKLDDNIIEIEKILADLDNMAKGIKGQNLTNQQIKIQTIDKSNQEQMVFSKNATPTPCMTGNNSTNCPSVTNALKNMPGFAELPDSFKDIASQATTLGDKLSGSTGLSGSTLSAADELANKANAVAKMLKARQASLEKLNPKLNINKAQGKFLDGLKNNVKNSLRKQGTTASGMMGSMGASGISGAAAGSGIGSDLSSKITPTQNVVDISAKGDGDTDKEKDSLKLDFGEDTAAVVAVDMSGGTLSKAPEYHIESNEISGENGPSLFEVISSRYIKSGYSKLLEEEPAKN